MSRPILSIITVNLNNSQGLRDTIQNIKQQTFSSYEHIIIDGGSTDASIEIIAEYESKSSYLTYWVSEPDKGIYDGMNKGIEHAQGEYLCFLNSGDCFANDILNQINFDGTQYIYGNVRMITQGGYQDNSYPDTPDLIYLSNHSLAHQTCFIHRSLFENHKYDTDYKIISDWAHALQCIIFDRCSYKYIPLTIAICDGNGISSNYQEINTERIKWFQEKLPAPLSQAFLECMAFDNSTFRPIIPMISKTRRFKIRVRKLITFLYVIHSLLSRKENK